MDFMTLFSPMINDAKNYVTEGHIVMATQKIREIIRMVDSQSQIVVDSEDGITIDNVLEDLRDMVEDSDDRVYHKRCVIESMISKSAVEKGASHKTSSNPAKSPPSVKCAIQ